MPWFSEVPTSGFGYPHAGSKLSPPQKPLSASNALELYPFRAFLLLSDRRKVPLPSFRSCVSSQNPFGPCTDATAVSSHLKSSSPYLQPDFLRRVGDSCSLGRYHLSGTPSEDPLRESPSFAAFPLALLSRRSYGRRVSEPQGFSAFGPVYPYEKGTGLFDVSGQLSPPTSLGSKPSADYFFISRIQEILRPLEAPLFASSSYPPNGSWGAVSATLQAL